MARLWNGPDGQVYEFPDGATDEEIQDYFLLQRPMEDPEGAQQWHGAVGSEYKERSVQLPPEHDSKRLLFPS